MEEAFEETASAMFEVMVSDDAGSLDGDRRSIEVDVTCKECNEVDLLIEFLNELITRSDIEGLVLTEIKVESICSNDEGMELKAVAYGIPVESAVSYLLTEVKAATYYGSRVEKRDDGLWYARCVVDL